MSDPNGVCEPAPPQVQYKRGRVRVIGEMTVCAAASLQPALFAALRRYKQATRLDLSQVTEFDTAGLQLLLGARRLATQQGKGLEFVDSSPAVREVLELCRLEADR